MGVRAKVRLASITNHSWSKEHQTFKFECVFDGATPENQRFNKSTPSGHFEMVIANPEAAKQFDLGKEYYVDFIPAN